MKIRSSAANRRWQFSLALWVVFILGSPMGLHAKPTWLKLEANDFVAYSNASEKDLTETAVEYAAFRQAFRSLFLAPGRVSPPTILVLFRRQSEFEEHIDATREPNKTTTNYTVEVDGTPLMAFPLAGDRDHALELTFEFETVWALRRAGYYVPIWMSQGAGEVLATLRLHKGHCIIGESSDGHDDQFCSGENIPWPHFFEIGESSPEYSGRDAHGEFHSQAWALMHWILFSDENSRERFTDLAQKLRTMPGLEAVEASTHTPEKQLRDVILKHLYRPRQRELPFDTAAVRATFKITPAPEAEVLAQTSNLLIASGKVLQGYAELDRARTLAPNHPAVLEALARRASVEGRSDDAAMYYRRAIAAGSKSVATYLRSAEARITESSVGGSDRAGAAGNNAALAIKEIHQALALNPGNVDSYRILGRAYFVSPNLKEDQIAELNPGVSLGEAGEYVRHYRGLLYARVGNNAAAIADFRAIAADTEASDNQRSRALESLDYQVISVASSQVEELVRSSQFEDAHKVLAEINESDLTDKGKQVIDRLRLWLSEAEGWDTVESLYNNGDWDKLEVAAKKYLVELPKGAHRRQVQHLLDEAVSQKKPAAPAATPASAP